MLEAILRNREPRTGPLSMILERGAPCEDTGRPAWKPSRLMVSSRCCHQEGNPGIRLSLSSLGTARQESKHAASLAHPHARRQASKGLSCGMEGRRTWAPAARCERTFGFFGHGKPTAVSCSDWLPRNPPVFFSCRLRMPGTDMRYSRHPLPPSFVRTPRMHICTGDRADASRRDGKPPFPQPGSHSGRDASRTVQCFGSVQHACACTQSLYHLQAHEENLFLSPFVAPRRELVPCLMPPAAPGRTLRTSLSLWLNDCCTTQEANRISLPSLHAIRASRTRRK